MANRGSGDVAAERRDLPTGVVTFLLTDIVGSTPMWDAHSEVMARSLARHDELIHNAVENHGGLVMQEKGEGDSTFSVFSAATDGVAAAWAAQRAIEREDWPQETPIQVRMALHTAQAFEIGSDYLGPAVNRVARVRGIALAGHVLVTSATRLGLAGWLPEGAALAEIGAFELRGISEPETVHLLVTHSENSAGAALRYGVIPLPVQLTRPPTAGFFGRGEELRLLLGAATEADERALRLFLIRGEAGVGKSTLAGRVAREAFARGWTVLYGRCDDGARAAYQPWAEALAYLVDRLPPAQLAALSPSTLASVARLVPAITERTGVTATAATGDPESDRRVMLDAVVATLAELSEVRPVVVVIDDLHWADESSLRLLGHVVAAAPTARVVLIGTIREGDPSEGELLASALAELARAQSATRIDLTGLPPEDLVPLVEAMGGGTSDSVTVAEELFRETGGNPYFCVELIQQLVNSGATTIGPVPGTVRDIVAHRAEQIGGPAADLLRTASVIGRSFDLALLSETMSLTVDTVLEYLELAEAARIVYGAHPGTFAFGHALIADALYQGLGAANQMRRHRQVAEALGRLGASRTAAELAHHWAAAGDPQRAFGHACRAGEQALEQLGPEESTFWFQRAHDLLSPTAANAADRAAVLVRLGQAQQQAGNQAFRDTLIEAGRVAIQSSTWECLIEAALLNSRGDPPSTVDIERVEMLEAALAAAGVSRQFDRARLLAALANELLFNDDFPRRKSLFDEAAAICEERQDTNLLRQVAARSVIAIDVPETLDQRDRVITASMRRPISPDTPVETFMLCRAERQLALELSDRRRADAAMHAMSQIAQRLRQPTLDWMLRWQQSCMALLDGDADESERHATEALQIGIDSGQPDALNVYGGQLLCIRAHQGRGKELADMVGSLASEFVHVPALRAALAQLSTTSADGPPITITADDVDALPYDVAWATGMSSFAEGAVRLGNRPVVEHLYRRLLPFRDQVISSHILCAGPAATYLGMLASELGEYEDAATHFLLATDLCRRLKAPALAARTKVEWARMLLKRGDQTGSATAAELLDAAAEPAHRHGYVAVGHDCATLRSLLP